jgi:hypothetical protein
MTNDKMKDDLIEVAMALDHATKELSRFVLNNQLEPYFSASEKLYLIIAALAQQASAVSECGIAFCLGCEPKNADGSCPDAAKEVQVSQPECTCPAKDMPFGRCCKAKLQNLEELAQDDQETMEAQDSEIKRLKEKCAVLVRRSPEFRTSVDELTDENEALKLRIEELEAATEHLGLTPKEAKDGLIRYKALKAERDKLQMECNECRELLGLREKAK